MRTQGTFYPLLSLLHSIPRKQYGWSRPKADLKASTWNEGDLGLIPGLGRSPGEEMATHSSILAWEIPWTEEPGGLLSMGSQRVRHNWVYFIAREIFNLLKSNGEVGTGYRASTVRIAIELLLVSLGMAWVYKKHVFFSGRRTAKCKSSITTCLSLACLPTSGGGDSAHLGVR